MRVVGKIIAGFFFVLFFLLFLVVGTIRFELLNSGFLFSSLERNGVYAKLPSELSKSFPNVPSLPEEEKEAYSKIISSVSPVAFQKNLEDNFSSVFNFLNGESKDINIFLPASILGIPGTKDINWSLSKNLPKETVKSFQIAYGIGDKLLLIWMILIVALVLLFLVAKRTVLLISGIITLLLGGVGKFFSLVVSNTVPSKPEPANVLLGLLGSSILSDIFLSWLILGVIFMLVWLFLKKQNRFS